MDQGKHVRGSKKLWKGVGDTQPLTGLEAYIN